MPRIAAICILSVTCLALAVAPAISSDPSHAKPAPRIALADAPQKAGAAQGATKAARIDDSALQPEAPVLEDIFEVGEPIDGWPFERQATAVGIEKLRFIAAPLRGAANATSFRVLPAPAQAAKPAIGDGEQPEEGEKFTLPKGFVAVAAAGKHANGSPWKIRCEKDESLMVYVPAGTFLQGTNDGPSHCGPEHTVFLDAFYIDLVETTNEQYERFREAARVAKKRFNPPPVAGDAHDPVLGLNWGEANFYTLWAGKSLPTEAQWEKAARGPSGFPFPWGRGIYLWQRPRTPAQIDAVGSFPCDVSPYGVFDLAGNAQEWCADWYVPTTNYYQELLESSASIPRNPPGAKAFNAQEKMHVVKGGHPQWYVWARTGVVNTDRSPKVGFRGVLNAKSDAKAAR